MPEGTIIGDDEMNRYRADEIMILTTGSQGEPMAGLSRYVYEQSPYRRDYAK